MKNTLAAVLLSTLPFASMSQAAWSTRADLLSAGAAASIVLHHLCTGADASSAQVPLVDRRLKDAARQWAAAGETTESNARWYLVDATNIKVRAMWQANEFRSCDAAVNLRHLAASQGFETP
jgi:hypothetical protein